MILTLIFYTSIIQIAIKNHFRGFLKALKKGNFSGGLSHNKIGKVGFFKWFFWYLSEGIFIFLIVHSDLNTHILKVIYSNCKKQIILEVFKRFKVR